MAYDRARLGGSSMAKIIPFKRPSLGDPFKKSRKGKFPLWKKSMNPWRGSSLRLGRMLPNMITLLSLCLGLTSIHFAFLLQWERAVSSVLLAGVLDGIDGRLARFLGNSTEFGAELDSLADFINFGVAPALLVFFFSLHQWHQIGWGICVFFSACMALRLARFNTQRLQLPDRAPSLSVGVPAPAAALLAMLPILLSFVTGTSAPPWIFGIVLGCTSLMMISFFPTFLINKLVIPQKYVGGVMLGLLILGIGLLTAPWETLLSIGILYILSFPISGYLFYGYGKKKQTPPLA